jgi:hypothetical protein
MRLIRFLIIMLIAVIPLFGETSIDISEKIFRYEKINGLGKIGFGLYDTGDSKYKIFDWNIKKTAEITISYGEGKAEIKNTRVDAFIYKNFLYIHPQYTRKINVYDLNLKGKFKS